MKRVLRYQLLVWPGFVEQRNGRLYGFEVQEVERVSQGIEKAPDSFLVEVAGSIQRTFHLHPLQGIQ